MMTSTKMSNERTLLEVSALSMRFGGLLAVDGVSLSVREQEVFAIIGPNGAGKTTVFNCISGFYQPTSGEIALQGVSIARRASHVVAQQGLVRTFQNIRLFKTLTVVENLLVAQHNQLNNNLLSGLLKLPGYRRAEKEALERAAYWLDQLGLTALANREAGTLSYGLQRRGLNPQEKQELQQLIDKLRREHGVAVLLIEHDMSLIMGISDRILVMEHGKPIVTGTPDQVCNDERVIKAYLGEE